MTEKVIWFYLAAAGLSGLYILRYMLGHAADKQCSYEQLEYRFISAGGGIYRAVIGYCIWQKNKKRAIDERFQEYFENSGCRYKVIARFPAEIPGDGWERLLNAMFWRTYILEMKPVSDVQEKGGTLSHNNTIVNVMKNNFGNITQSIDSGDQSRDIQKLCAEFEKLLLEKRIDAPALKNIEEFKKKVEEETASRKDALDFIERMKIYVPATTAVINLTSTIFDILCR